MQLMKDDQVLYNCRQQSLLIIANVFCEDFTNFRSQIFPGYLLFEKSSLSSAYFVQEVLANAQMRLREFFCEIKSSSSFLVQTEMLLDIHLIVHLLYGSIVKKKLFYENYLQRKREKERVFEVMRNKNGRKFELLSLLIIW